MAHNVNDKGNFLLHSYITHTVVHTTMRLLPLMYIFKISDILFFLKNPKNNFNINTYISFSTGNTRSYGVQLRHNTSSTNKEHHFYFNRISHLWNSLPIIDLNLPISIIKSKIKSYFWQHFITNFDSDNVYIIFVLVAPVYLITPQAIIIICDT